MSREQANTFKKYRDAEDATGNLSWAARLQHKALRQGPEAAQRIDVERDFELRDDEKMVWRLMRLPRRYIELEHAGLLTTEKLRGFLRGLVAADVLDIVEGSDAKALIPAEVKRTKADVEGKELPRSKEPLRGRVFRPELDKPAADASSTPAAPPPTPAPMPASPKTNGSMPSPPKTNGSVPAPARASSSSSSPLTGDDRAYKAEIDRAFAAAQKQNHYEFLGLAAPSTDAAVRAAYMRLAREYHPDRVSGVLAQDEGLKSKVDTLFKRLGEAQAALATNEARGTYDRALDALGEGGGAPTQAGKKQRRPLEAKNAFLMAETFFKKKDYKQAEAHYRQAAMFDDQDPKILCALAWCVYMNPDHPEASRTSDAKKRFNELVNQHRHADAAYRLGLILRKANDEGAAQRQFALAHKLDPHHMEAEREVRLTDMRHKKAEDERKDSGFLGKLGLKK
jgi:curved DNA-binding protein CbpA